MDPQSLTIIRNSIKTIPDYPKPGIQFRDVTALIEDGDAFKRAVSLMLAPFKEVGITKVVGTEARGFIFGAPIALALGVGFIPVRKPNKLPRETISETYELEYGMDTLELHTDAIVSGDRVLLVDDLLATGGTIEATTNLVRRMGGEVVGASFVISLPDIGGEKRLASLGVECHYLCQFEGE